MELGPLEARVLGCLLEKQRTTPETYPLTLNALRLACNQATNRDPVLDLDDGRIRDALHRLGRRGWTRLASGAGSRAPKYRHLLDDALGLGNDELAVLAVLMLRGPQTPGELRTRTERLHRFAGAELDETMERLAARGHVERLERRPGQKEARYRQLLTGERGEGEREPAPAVLAAAPPLGAAPPLAAGEPPAPGADPASSLADRVAALEAEVARLRAEVESLGGARAGATPGGPVG